MTLHAVYDGDTGRIEAICSGPAVEAETRPHIEIPDGTDVTGKMVDPETESLVDDPDYTTAPLIEYLNQATIPSEQKQAYRDGAAVWEQAKLDWQAAKADADAAAQEYDDAETTQEMADALDARLDALQAQEVAVAALFNDGVIPALDVLFKVAMGEEP